MDIYLNRLPMDTFRHRKLKQGNRFFLALAGINVVITGGCEIAVEPVYAPLLTIDRRGSLVFIEIGRGSPHYLVVLSPTRPFVHVERTDHIDLSDEE